MAGYFYILTQIYLRKQRKIITLLENSKMDNLKKKWENDSRFDQPLFRVNLTADRIWLLKKSLKNYQNSISFLKLRLEMLKA
jgi:hypothetical protein